MKLLFRKNSRHLTRALALESLEERRLFSTNLTEFTVPTAAGSPEGVTLGSDGKLWFTEFNGNKIARQSAGGFTNEFPLPTNAHPYGIVSGPDGNLWFVMEGINKIGQMNTDGVLLNQFPINNPGSQAFFITNGPDGNVWFTDTGANKICRITPAGVITAFSSGLSPNSNTVYITAGADGNLWFAENFANKIGRITPAGVITEFSSGLTASSGLRAVALGPDGNIWFTEATVNKIGKITPAGVITEFNLPTAAGKPEGIVTGPDGNLWFTEFAKPKVGQMSPTGVVLAEYIIPNNPDVTTFYGAIITNGPHDTLVFVEPLLNKIGTLHDVVDPNRAFVQSLYHAALSRTAASSELDYWVGVIVSSGTPAVVNGIERSTEAYTLVVKAWYNGYLGRNAQNGEEQSFVTFLLNGGTEEQALASLLSSDEYFNHTPAVIGGVASNENFIGAVYAQLLSRTPSSGDVSFWVSRLPAIGRSGFVSSIINSFEYRNHFIPTYYYNLLHRASVTQGEVDGWNNSGLPLLQIKNQFEASLEFYLVG